jgi:hypothetical protein
MSNQKNFENEYKKLRIILDVFKKCNSEEHVYFDEAATAIQNIKNIQNGEWNSKFSEQDLAD